LQLLPDTHQELTYQQDYHSAQNTLVFWQ